MNYLTRAALAAGIVGVVFGGELLLRKVRKARYRRGRKLARRARRARGDETSLVFGNDLLPASAATQHFLVVGTTGSGKSLLQRRLMKGPLRRIAKGSDTRAVIFDAKSDTVPYLRRIGVTCPVYSLHPFEARDISPCSVAWDIAVDITSLARAQNLVSSLIPEEKGGNNRYFTDAARQVVTEVAASLMRHTPGAWTFADFVFACLSRERMQAVLRRDADGRDVLDAFFGDERTAYQVFTTIVSRMTYYKPVAATWQRLEVDRKLSIRDWLSSDSILLLGSNATVKAPLDAINQIVFRVMTEEIDVQPNSETRRTWVWIDEARLSGSLLRGEMLPYLAVKGRSKGASLVVSFQDIEGFREAAGLRIANEIIAQCSNKALLRLESEESASWASKVLGQFEAIETFWSVSGELARRSRGVSEQRVMRDAVLPSEFMEIPVTSKETGLTGYFVSPHLGAVRDTVSPDDLEEVVVPEADERELGYVARPEKDQWLLPWVPADQRRLGLDIQAELDEEEEEPRKKKLKLRRGVSRVA